MRDFTQTPVYQGARHQVGQVPQGTMPRDLTNPAIIEAGEHMRQHLSTLERTFKLNEDAAQAMEEDAAMRLIEQKYMAEFEQRLQLANGAEGSFFEEDGTKRETEFQNFISEYQQELRDATKGGYWTAQVGQAAAQKRDARIAAFPLQMEFARAKQTRTRGIKACTDAYNLAMEQEDYEGAAAAVEVGRVAGLFSENEATLKHIGINKAAAGAEIARKLDDDPVGLAEEIDKGAYSDVLSHGERENVRRTIRQKLTENNNTIVQQAAENGGMGFPSVVGDDAAPSSKSGAKSGSSKKQSMCEFMEDSGDFTQQEINWRVRQSHGEDVTQQVMQAARNEAMAFDIDKDMAEQRISFMDKYTRLGLPKEMLTSIWNEAEGARGSLTTISIDPKALLEKETMAGRTLLDTELWKEVQAHLEAKDEDGNPWSFAEGSYLRKDLALMELIKAKEDDDAKTLAAKYERYQSGVVAELTKERILARYNQWRKSEGKDASPLAQYNMLRSISKTMTGAVLGGSENISPESQVGTEIATYNSNINTQRDRHTTWQTEELPQEEALLNIKPAQQVSLRFDDKQMDKPVGVLVPESWLTDRGRKIDMESATIEATFDNKHFRVFRVVGTCEGETPMMTHAAAVRGGWNQHAAYKANIRFMYGKYVPGIIERQEAALQEAEQTRGQANLQQHGMGGAILMQEARVDRNGNLAVYYLPKGDGGGSYEVAGINNKNHPQMASRLKGLVETGRYEEARREAESYIMKFTQPAADWLKQGGVTDNGVELFLRDIYMNGGEGGAKKVLNRTLGLPDDASGEQTAQKLQEYMQQHTARELLEALREKRLAWYAAIAKANPEKRQFLNGWDNRTRSIYNQAINNLS